MKVNPITLASGAYGLITKLSGNSELKEQRAMIADMQPYYDACEKGKIYDAPAAITEAAAKQIKEKLSVGCKINMGFPGEVGHFSISADVTIYNNSDYDMDVVGVLVEPEIGGIQFGDAPDYTLLDWIDLGRLTGRYIAAGASETVRINFNYMSLPTAERKTLRKIMAEKLGFEKKLSLTSNKSGECSIGASVELVVKKNRTAFSDAKYVTFGIGDTPAQLEWKGANYYPGSLKDQEDTIQNNKKSDKYGYLALARFFDTNPVLHNNKETDGPVKD